MTYSSARLGFSGLGMTFSLIEQRIIMSHLLSNFEWDLAPGVHDDGLKIGKLVMGVLSPKEIPIRFRPRMRS